MHRRKLERYLRAHGCQLHHHGRKHDVWRNTTTQAMASVPRHQTIKKATVRGICRELGIPLPDGF
ncbi:MAG TPA: type II toxin-antitoxin system HicA family toxin [Gemmata sp.]|nr:type II toxin-antitoxin system HicA family toxin [Gemmata sp.]